MSHFIFKCLMVVYKYRVHLAKSDLLILIIIDSDLYCYLGHIKELYFLNSQVDKVA